MASSRTSELFLYAGEDKSQDDKKVSIDVSNADMKFEGPQDVVAKFNSRDRLKRCAHYRSRSQLLWPQP